MLISKDLYKFLKDYLKWVNNGAVNYEPYYRGTGLYENVPSFTNGVSDHPLLKELPPLFHAEGLDSAFPFGKGNYEARFRNRTQHLDPIRLEWIKDHIEEYENALTDSNITFSMILAKDAGSGIGLDNDLPWKGIVDNKEDMKWFVKNTKNKIVVMGYNTWLSIGKKPLPNRENIVLTNTHYFKEIENLSEHPTSDVSYFQSKKDFFTFLDSSYCDSDVPIEIVIIGGAQIYKTFQDYISKIYLTDLKDQYLSDTAVELDLDYSRLVYLDKTPSDLFSFQIWEVTKETRANPNWLKIIHNDV